MTIDANTGEIGVCRNCSKWGFCPDCQAEFDRHMSTLRRGENMKKLYRFRADFGRMGHLEGIFVEDSGEMKKLVGQTVYFGECLGKHSEVELDIEASHFSVLTDDRAFIQKFEELELATGVNPFSYLYEG